MKKVFSVLAAFVVAATMSVNAAPERGKLIHVDNSTSKNLKPQIAFCQDRVDGQDVTTLLVKTVNVNAYNEFNDASRVLVRFADGKAIRLNRVAGSEVQKNKHTEKKGNATISYYDTFTSYEVTQEVIDKLKAGIAIIKVRIVFKENDSKDYDIVEGYYKKFRSNAPLEMKYSQLGAYDTAYTEFSSADESIGKVRVWYPRELENGETTWPMIMVVNASGTPASSYEPFFPRLASWGFVVVGNEDGHALPVGVLSWSATRTARPEMVKRLPLLWISC